MAYPFVMAPRVQSVILRGLGPTEGAGVEEFHWLTETEAEPMMQTNKEHWVGYLAVKYTTDPPDERRGPLEGMVPVLIHPSGLEQAGFPVFFGYGPGSWSTDDAGNVEVDSYNHSPVMRIELDLPEAGEYRLQLRDGVMALRQGGIPRPGGDIYAEVAFRRS